MLKYIQILGLIFLVGMTHSMANAQHKGEETWDILSHLKFKPTWNEQYQMKINQAVFSKEILAMNGREIVVYGYLLPEKGYKTHREFVLSSLPYNLCYFCGKAGPETVMQVSSLDAVRYSEKPITLKGTLMLNMLDPMELPYYLMDAKIVKD